MPICRCCCIDFYVLSDDAPGSPSGQNTAYRRLKMDDVAYPSNTLQLLDQPSAPTAAVAIMATADLHNGFVFVMNTGTRKLAKFDAKTLAHIADVITLPANTQNPFCCDWQNQKLYYAVKTVASNSGSGPTTHTYEFEIRSVDYDGSNPNTLIATDSGTATADFGPTATINVLRWTPLDDGRLYYELTKSRYDGSVPSDNQDAYLKWVPSAGGGSPTTLISLVNPASYTYDSASRVKDVGISTDREELAWIEHHVGRNSFGGAFTSVYYLKKDDIDVSGPTTIKTWTQNTSDPDEDTPQFLHVIEKEDAIYFLQVSRASPAGPRLQRIEWDGTGFTTLYDSHHADFGGLASYPNHDIAIGCGQEFKGAAYQGDG